jgi:AraC-like DNA-binding protein
MQSGSATMRRFPLIEAVGLDGLEAGVARLFGSCAVDAPRQFRSAQFRSTINYRSFSNISLMYGAYSAAFAARMGPYESFVQGFPMSGYGEHRVGRTLAVAAPGIISNTIISPGESAELNYKTTFDHLVLSIKPAPLLHKLEAMIGSPTSVPLTFIKRASYNRPEAHALRRLVLFLAEESSGESPQASPLVLAELEQAVMVAFLCNNESNFSPTLKGEPKASAPWQVRRAEEYIAAHWDQPITIEALAVATDVSARSLFHSFRRARGYSPMALVKQIRLNRAKEMLSRPQADTSVTGVAYACGFGNLGHFAADYFDRFGERPSDTLRSSRS